MARGATNMAVLTPAARYPTIWIRFVPFVSNRVNTKTMPGTATLSMPIIFNVETCTHQNHIAV